LTVTGTKGLDLLGQLTVDGQRGNDRLTIDDRQGTGLSAGLPPDITTLQRSLSYTVTAQDVSRAASYSYTTTNGGGGGVFVTDIAYQGIDYLELDGSNVGADFSVTDTPAKTSVIINTGAAKNTVNAGSSVNRLIDIVDLTVNGGSSGATTLNLYDQGNADGYDFSGPEGTFVQTRPTFVVTGQSVTRNDAETVTFPSGEVLKTTIVGSFHYNNLAGLNLYGGSSGNGHHMRGQQARKLLLQGQDRLGLCGG
jgi:hypothetical protein